MGLNEVNLGEDFYQILGVNVNADLPTIKTAYWSLAKKFHPDFNPGDKDAEERFKKVAGAYEVLGNAESREFYDFFCKIQGHEGAVAEVHQKSRETDESRDRRKKEEEERAEKRATETAFAENAQAGIDKKIAEKAAEAAEAKRRAEEFERNNPKKPGERWGKEWGF